MRAFAVVIVLFGAGLSGCASRPSAVGARTAGVAAPPASSATAPVAAAEHDPRGGIPRVIRRILAEEKELVDHSLLLAAELPDAGGRQRALDEVRAIAAELARIEAPLDSADGDVLDETVAQLIRQSTRIALVHEALRTATNRTTAMSIE